MPYQIHIHMYKRRNILDPFLEDPLSCYMLIKPCNSVRFFSRVNNKNTCSVFVAFVSLSLKVSATSTTVFLLDTFERHILKLNNYPKLLVTFKTSNMVYN